jgi:hypothetical protein
MIQRSHPKALRSNSLPRELPWWLRSRAPWPNSIFTWPVAMSRGLLLLLDLCVTMGLGPWNAAPGEVGCDDPPLGREVWEGSTSRDGMAPRRGVGLSSPEEHPFCSCTCCTMLKGGGGATADDATCGEPPPLLLLLMMRLLMLLLLPPPSVPPNPSI